MNTPVHSTLTPAMASEPAQYLTFMLGAEVYAIGILGIKEIIEYPDLTVVPMMPACVRQLHRHRRTRSAGRWRR
jgi:purine-binding chemotaxis protein CheW